MAAVMAPGMRDATSHAHLVEVFSFPTTPCHQTVGLGKVETLLGQLQQRIVRKYLLLSIQIRPLCGMTLGPEQLE